MNFEVENHDKYLTIRSSVEKLDTTVAPELKSILVMHNNEGQRNIIIDLSSATYCDSSGLSAILVGSRLCKTASGTFVICGLQPMVEKLVKISQLDTVLNITPTVDEAQDFVMMEEVERDLNEE